jgi:hypothetical protein
MILDSCHTHHPFFFSAESKKESCPAPAPYNPAARTYTVPRPIASGHQLGTGETLRQRIAQQRFAH